MFRKKKHDAIGNTVKMELDPQVLSPEHFQYRYLRALINAYPENKAFSKNKRYGFVMNQVFYQVYLTSGIRVSTVELSRGKLLGEDNFLALATEMNADFYVKGELYPLSSDSKKHIHLVHVRVNIIISRKGQNGELVDAPDYFVIHEMELGSGSYGSVYPVLSKFSIVNDSFIYDDTQYVIKHFNDENKKTGILEEFLAAANTPHLKPYFPIRFNNEIFMPMLRMPGEQLSDIIDELLVDDRTLSLADRLQLGFCILKIIKAQVVDLGLVHNDIKPDNIMVDLSVRPYNVNIVDYGSAASVNQEHKGLGLYSHMPPEMYARCVNYQHPSVDVFSCGRLLHELYGVNLDKPSTRRLLSESRLGLYRNGLFSHKVYNDFNPQAHQKLDSLLLSMCDQLFLARPTIEKSIEFMQEVIDLQKCHEDAFSLAS